MSNKISKAILMISLLVFLSTMLIIMGSLYSYFSSVMAHQLKIESQFAARGVSLSGEEYLSGFDSESYRITWIDPDGTVLYDNQASSESMKNHLEREEILEAFQTGYGESSRYSDTLSERFLYSARLLEDGSVIRVSHVQNTIWTLILGFAQPICLVILIALILSCVLASRVSKKITAPINAIDPDQPLEYIDKEGYQEIRPLLVRMNQQQAQIRQNQAELEKTSQIRQEFTANVSHELKTPLHAISGYAELLEQGMVKEDDIMPFVGRIRAESQRMTKLVEDIIDLTKLDGGGMDMPREQTDLLRIAENAVDSLQTTAESCGIRCTVSGEPAEMTGIPQVLYSVVYNLCDNAIKYNRKGGFVHVCVESLPTLARLTVKDNGIGIPEECQERIFERFYRVDKSRSKEVGGTGLGLSIVKHAVTIHHGKLHMNSTPGQGTEFSIEFPKDQVIR